MGLFTKSSTTLKRDAKETAHKAWHTWSLQVGRKRGWFTDDVAAFDAVAAIIAAAHAEPSDPETGKFKDVSAEEAEAARLRDVINRRRGELAVAEEKLEMLRIAKDDAVAGLAIEEFKHGQLESMEKALVAFHAAHQEVVKAAAAGIRVASEFTIPFFTEELVQSWQHRKQLWCNPVPKPEPDPCTIVVFTRDYSAGSVGGGLYVPDDCAGFDREKCAELIAQGFAVWRTPSPRGEELVAAARKRLAVKPTYEGSAPENLGWAVNE